MAFIIMIKEKDGKRYKQAKEDGKPIIVKDATECFIRATKFVVGGYNVKIKAVH